MNKNQSTGIVVIIAIILIALLSIAFEGPNTSTSEISYSQFLNKVQMKQIESVVISKGELRATPKADEPQKTAKPTQNTNPLNINKLQEKAPKAQFKVQIPEQNEELIDLLKDNNVEINIQKPQDGSWMSVLGSVIIPVIFVIIMIILMRNKSIRMILIDRI